MPRPILQGSLARQIDLYFHATGKVYRVLVTAQPDGMCRVYFEHGPNGRHTQGGEKTKSPVSGAAADSMADKLSESKRAKGYVVLSDKQFAGVAAQSSPASQPAKAEPQSARPRLGIGSLSEGSLAMLRNSF